MTHWWNQSITKIVVTHAFWLCGQNTGRSFLILALREHGFFSLNSMPGHCHTARELIDPSTFYVVLAPLHLQEWWFYWVSSSRKAPFPYNRRLALDSILLLKSTSSLPAEASSPARAASPDQTYSWVHETVPSWQWMARCHPFQGSLAKVNIWAQGFFGTTHCINQCGHILCPCFPPKT